MENEKNLAEKVDFNSIFDLKLSLEAYTKKLDELLKNSGLGAVEKLKLFRQKVQEFKDEKRKPHHELNENKKAD
jgi:ElaB/YqjD/DUF883 family membrane-anchored ribosome-binding protein